MIRLVIILATLLVAFADLHAQAKWLQAATDEVRILSDASPKTVIEYVVKYTAFRRAFIELLAPVGHRLPPVILIVFRDESELRNHLAKSGGAGHTVAFTIQVDNAALLALDGSGDRKAGLSVAFEADTVWSLRRVGCFLPLWAAQGTGEVFASLRISKGQCVIDGSLDGVESTWKQEANLPWKRFFEIYQGSPEYAGKEAGGIYQAQAWALMNLVLFQDGKPRESLDRLARKIRESSQEQEAAEAFLGIPSEKFLKAIDHQLRKKHSFTVPFDEKAILSRLKIEPADEAEVNVRLGELLLANGRESEGDAAIDRAAALSPKATFVNEALARRELRRNETAKAAEYYRAAIAAGSVDTNGYLVSAAERLRPSWALGFDFAGGGGKNVEPALGEIHHALALDPGDMWAWQLLGRAYYVAEQASAAGAEELGRVPTDDPDGLEVRYYRGLLYYRLGKKDESRADLDQVIRDARTSQNVRIGATLFKAQMQLADDQLAIERLVNESRYAEALAVADRGIEQAADIGIADRYQLLRQCVNEASRWAEVVASYYRKDWAVAIAGAEAFLVDYPHSPRCADVRRLMASADELGKR